MADFAYKHQLHSSLSSSNIFVPVGPYSKPTGINTKTLNDFSGLWTGPYIGTATGTVLVSLTNASQPAMGA